jgi:hypothetical protein
MNVHSIDAFAIRRIEFLSQAWFLPLPEFFRSASNASVA